MANVHGLNRSNSDSDDDENNRFVGGISDRGGGSGLAVQPNNANDQDDRDRVFGVAENATADDSTKVRRTITMYRDGFIVDDGPYRRLDDPENADFLRALAMGVTPRELTQGSESGSGNVVVGLVDKRNQDYVPEFQSFSGAGNSLGTRTTNNNAAGGSATSNSGLFTTSSLPSTPAPVDQSQPTTSIAVRLLNGKRQVVKLNLTSTVADLASHLRSTAENESVSAFILVSGFPPTPITDSTASIQDAGLKGAQVSMQKAD